MMAYRLRGPWPHVSVSYEIRLINSVVIPEAAKRLSRIQPRVPSLPLDSGLAAARPPGMTAH
jgi:hypothetical protein